jgi:hypothetical protein
MQDLISGNLEKALNLSFFDYVMHLINTLLILDSRLRLEQVDKTSISITMQDRTIQGIII